MPGKTLTTADIPAVANLQSCKSLCGSNFACSAVQWDLLAVLGSTCQLVLGGPDSIPMLDAPLEEPLVSTRSVPSRELLSGLPSLMPPTMPTSPPAGSSSTDGLGLECHANPGYVKPELAVDPALQPGKEVLLVGNDKRYCGIDECQRNEGHDIIRCNAVQGKLTEAAHKFVIFDASAGRIVLMAPNGKFCGFNTDAIRCNQTSIGPNERFQFNELGKGRVSLRGGDAIHHCSDLVTKVSCSQLGPVTSNEVFTFEAPKESKFDKSQHGTECNKPLKTATGVAYGPVPCLSTFVVSCFRILSTTRTNSC